MISLVIDTKNGPLALEAEKVRYDGNFVWASTSNKTRKIPLANLLYEEETVEEKIIKEREPSPPTAKQVNFSGIRPSEAFQAAVAKHLENAGMAEDEAPPPTRPYAAEIVDVLVSWSGADSGRAVFSAPAEIVDTKEIDPKLVSLLWKRPEFDSLTQEFYVVGMNKVGREISLFLRKKTEMPAQTPTQIQQAISSLTNTLGQYGLVGQALGIGANQPVSVPPIQYPPQQPKATFSSPFETPVPLNLNQDEDR
jgi:hypothetical protein